MENTKWKAQYCDYLQQLKDKWKDMPRMNIDYNQLGYKIRTQKNSEQENEIPNLATNIWKAITFDRLRHKSQYLEQFPLHPTSGTIKSGTMTLVLGPRGSGRSVLLRSLAGLESNSPKQLGSIQYRNSNNNKIYDVPHVRKLCGYVGQDDKHKTLLTVKETLDFAFKTSTAPIQLLNPTEEFKMLHNKRVDMIINLLGLKECENTVMGNNIIRGTSGGQKRKTSIGEILVSNARFMALDEITNGLDAKAAFEIMLLIREICTITGSSTVVALLQPTPEVYELFDNLILMKEGHVVYSGPRIQVVPYFESIGIPISQAQIDQADFITEFLIRPKEVYFKTDFFQEEKKEVTDTAPAVPLTTQLLLESYQSSSHNHDVQISFFLSCTQEKLSSNECSVYTNRQYYAEYSHSFIEELALTLSAQWILFKRNKNLIFPRLIQSVLIGLVYGSLWYQLNPDSFIAKGELILQILVFLAFANMGEIPWTGEAKAVTFKHAQLFWYNPLSYVLAAFICHFVLLIPETVIFGSIIYWMTGFAIDTGRYLFYLLILICCGMSVSTLFRLITYAAPTNARAQQISGPTVGFAILFSGILITRSNIPDYLIELYWLLPFSWVTRSIGQSEFGSESYTKSNTGVVYLGVWDIDTSFGYRYAAVGYLLAQVIVFIICSGAILKSFALAGVSNVIGTLRLTGEVRSTDVNLIDLPRLVHASSKAIPFAPTDVTFDKINYWIDVLDPKTKKRFKQQLLWNITGYAKAGEITALMGPSGAGKSTLLDCLASRKTIGHVEGTIKFNGREVNKTESGRICGYCLQDDIHTMTDTVREALRFSAQLRLPQNTTDAHIYNMVNYVLEQLEIVEIQNSLVSKLSPAQLKLLTIGVELSANPNVLFLDEPTSGLDSRSALIVMHAIVRVSKTGRSVICTIHQPSADLFSYFHRLLLLSPGGKLAYFGPNNSHMLTYFHKATKIQKPPTLNPATYVLNILGTQEDILEMWGEIIVHERVVMETEYLDSSICAENKLEHQALEQESSENPLRLEPERNCSQVLGRIWCEFVVFFHRLMLVYWRYTDYILTRLFVMALLGLITGLIYSNSSISNESGLISVISSQYLVLHFSGVTSCVSAYPLLFANRAIFYREQSSAMYHKSVYVLGISLIEIPYLALGSLIFLIPYYFLIGFNNVSEDFFAFYLALFLTQVIYNAFGQFLCCALPNIIVATVAQGASFAFVLLFGGLPIQRSLIPAGWKWVHYMLWLNKAWIATNITQFHCNSQNCPMTEIVQSNADGSNSVTSIPAYKYISDFLGVNLDYVQYWQEIGWLFLTYAVIKILTFGVVIKLNHNKR